MFEEMNQQTQFIVLIVKEEANRLWFENVRQSGDTFQTADLERRSRRSKANSSKMRTNDSYASGCLGETIENKRGQTGDRFALDFIIRDDGCRTEQLERMMHRVDPLTRTIDPFQQRMNWPLTREKRALIDESEQ